jgi:hypothetical protein
MKDGEHFGILENTLGYTYVITYSNRLEHHRNDILNQEL